MKYIAIVLLVTGCASSAIKLESSKFLETPYIVITKNDPVLHLNYPGTAGIDLEVTIKDSKVIIVPIRISQSSSYRFRVRLAEIEPKLKILNTTGFYYFWMNPDGNLRKLETK